MISFKFLLSTQLSTLVLSLALLPAKGCTAQPHASAQNEKELASQPATSQKKKVSAAPKAVSSDSVSSDNTSSSNNAISSAASVKNAVSADKIVSDATFKPADKQKITSLLKEASALKEKPKSWMLWFGKKFLGVPYVGGTLDAAKDEKLVINTSELDCTTYVEMVTALTRTLEKGKTSFADFCEELKHVRYIGGDIAYEKRQHYFTVWINDNVDEGIITDIQQNPPFTKVQHIQVNWMTTHPSSYKMLNGNSSRLKGIKVLEASINGKSYRYIPKESIVDNSLFRKTIHDGDIIVIITNKKGLDTTHIGLASWHQDGLHLLNASSIHKKVIDEPMTLRTYMMKHPSQIGIRVCRVK